MGGQKINGMEQWTPGAGGSLPFVGFLHVLSSGYFQHSIYLLIRPVLNSIYYLFKLIRRPRLILDFALTLVFNHLVLTTYYSAALPTSLFYWVVLLGGAVLTIVVAEQLCVRREMTEGLRMQPDDEDVEEMEMGGLLPRTD